MKSSVSGCSLKRVHCVKTKAKGEHTNTWHTCIVKVGVVTLTHPVGYHWRQLPQASCLMQQKFCCDKTCLLSWQLLTWQNYVCCNKIFLSRQIQLCCNKHTFVSSHMFVVTKHVFYRDKSFLVANTCLSWLKFVVTKVLLRQTSMLLSQQETCFVVTLTTLTNFCHNKSDTCGSSRQW